MFWLEKSVLYEGVDLCTRNRDNGENFLSGISSCDYSGVLCNIGKEEVFRLPLSWDAAWLWVDLIRENEVEVNTLPLLITELVLHGKGLFYRGTENGYVIAMCDEDLDCPFCCKTIKDGSVVDIKWIAEEFIEQIMRDFVHPKEWRLVDR